MAFILEEHTDLPEIVCPATETHLHYLTGLIYSDFDGQRSHAWWDMGTWDDCYKNGQMLVLNAEEGFVPDCYLGYTGRHTLVTIQELYTAPRKRRRGYGSQIIQPLICAAQERHIQKLKAAVATEAGKRLMSSLGFERHRGGNGLIYMKWTENSD